MDKCIFCKIVKGEIPSTKVYEDASFLSFTTIEPVSNGHILVIPKKHFVWMQSVDDKTISEIFQLSKRLMQAIKKGTGCDLVQLLVEGKEVPHFHIHLIPRYMDDNLPVFPTKKYKDKEAEEMTRKIIKAL